MLVRPQLPSSPTECFFTEVGQRITDKLLTRTLKSALNVVDMRLLGHFLVTGNQVVWIAEVGLPQHVPC